MILARSGPGCRRSRLRVPRTTHRRLRPQPGRSCASARPEQQHPPCERTKARPFGLLPPKACFCATSPHRASPCGYLHRHLRRSDLQEPKVPWFLSEDVGGGSRLVTPDDAAATRGHGNVALAAAERLVWRPNLGPDLDACSSTFVPSPFAVRASARGLSGHRGARARGHVGRSTTPWPTIERQQDLHRLRRGNNYPGEGLRLTRRLSSRTPPRKPGARARLLPG